LHDAGGADPAVIGDDFEAALNELRARQSSTRSGRPIGFGRESI
jgi:hypothetical protein